MDSQVGVRAMRLGSGDTIVGTEVVAHDAPKDTALMVLSEKGFGKKTKIADFKVQKRGGAGIRCAMVTDKTGNIMASRIVDESVEEVVVISKKSQVIRTELSQVPTSGRSTQGVRVMKLRAGDSIAALICL
jgi:DNA gyrase subunit A